MIFSTESARIFEYHAFLVGDAGRLGAFEQAIGHSVKPGQVVLDIGTGTGVLALMACRAGARRVYAVEAGAVAGLARHLVRNLGLEDRIQVLEESSTRVSLAEEVDVIVTDTTANFGLEGGLLGTVIDARDRFLKSTGTIIPRSVELVAAPVEAPRVYADKIDFWGRSHHGLDFSPLRSCAANNLFGADLSPGSLLAEPAALGTVLLTQVAEPVFRGQAEFTLKRSGVLHGIGGWMRCRLTEAITLTNGPVGRQVDYVQVLLPIEEPIPVQAGQRVTASVRSHDGRVWRWQVQIESAPGAPARRFDQSTLRGFPLSPDDVERQTGDFHAPLSARGRAEWAILELIQQGKTIDQIEAELRGRPGTAATPRTAVGLASARQLAGLVRSVVARCT